MNRSLFVAAGLLMLAWTACSPVSRRDPAANRLLDSDSPYLRQHAYNPVDWYPWEDAAFEKAQAKDRLLIISIGYSACHWCHVMEEESFSDTVVATLMNERFVSIKVDREQRPDLDQVYMQAAMMTSQRSGWPLNVIALPDGRPLWGGTYLPRDRWLDLLQRIDSAYQAQPGQLDLMASQVASGMAQLSRPPFLPQAPAPDVATPTDAANGIRSLLDPRWGGFAGAPKFPMPDVFRFLLHYGSAAGADWATEAVQQALTGMAKGGIYDHVGGGFARYSVDSTWQVPHFEKMLYDNAQLLSLYAEAFRATADPRYAEVLGETIGFLQREMTDSLGGLYTSLDADSEGQEGAYYVWTEKKFLKTLGMKGKMFKDYFHVVPQGNWEGKNNVLFLREAPAVIAQRYGYSEERFREMIPIAKNVLREERESRERPHRDEKILAGWNGLMIEGYAQAYRALGADSILQAAREAAEFVLGAMKTPEGGLYRSYFEGQARIPAFADDYGYLIEGLVALYQVTFEERWLREAEQLMEYARAHFQEAEGDYFFLTEHDAETLVVRPLEISDNVTPSANASLARGLFLLGTYLYEESYLEQSQRMLQQIQPQVRANAASYAHWARLSLWLAQPPYEVAIVGDDWATLAPAWWQRYDPQVLLLGGAEEGTLPLLERKRVPDETRIYVCQDKSCRLPVTDNEAAFSQLSSMNEPLP